MELRNNKVAVIGLGAMGLPIALNLVKSGREVQVWNRSQPALDQARVGGAKPVAALNAIDAAIVLTVLPDMPQVHDVLNQGLRDALIAGDILVIMGTVSPLAVQELGEELLASGIHLLDAPVSGGDVGAQQATLSIMVGGASEVLELVRPTFEAIGKTIKLLGPLGAGEMAKACNQIVVAVTLTALAEAITLGRKAGLDTTALLDILAGGLANSQALTVKRSKYESDDYTPGGSALFQLKDLNFAVEAGAATGTSLPITEKVRELFAELIEHGDGGLDHSGIIREIERRSQSH